MRTAALLHRPVAIHPVYRYLFFMRFSCLPPLAIALDLVFGSVPAAAGSKVSLQLIADGLTSPVAYTRLPDGRALLADQVCIDEWQQQLDAWQGKSLETPARRNALTPAVRRESLIFREQFF